MFWKVLVVSYLVAIASAQDEESDDEVRRRRFADEDSDALHFVGEAPAQGEVSDDTGGIKPQDAMEGVTELNSKDFAGFSVPWVVHFYAPWNSWAIRFAPVWSEVGLLLGKKTDVLRVGKFDVTTDTEFAEKHDVHAFPAIILFNGKKGHVMHYDGNWDPEGIAEFVYLEAGIKASE